MPEIVVYDVSLFELRCDTIDSRSVTAVNTELIVGDCRCQSGFAVFPRHNEKYFPELSVTALIYDSEDRRHKSLLPQLQLQRIRGKWPFCMKTMRFNPIYCGVCLLRIKCKPLFLQ